LSLSERCQIRYFLEDVAYQKESVRWFHPNLTTEKRYKILEMMGYNNLKDESSWMFNEAQAKREIEMQKIQYFNAMKEERDSFSSN